MSHASGRYSSQFEKTTVAYPIAEGKNKTILVFDLRYDVEDLLAAEKDGTYIEKYGNFWQKENPKKARIDFSPIVKPFQFNHCPAVAPLGVLEKDKWLGKDSVDARRS